MGLYIFPSGYFLPISGGTVSGQTVFTAGLSADTFSSGTIYSGGTDLNNIFAPKNGYLVHKSGNVSGNTFAGNPKIATVTFTTPFIDNNYSISIISDTIRSWTISGKTNSSFIINSNTDTTFDNGDVLWMAMSYGESFS